jgi:hypothetical protein
VTPVATAAKAAAAPATRRKTSPTLGPCASRWSTPNDAVIAIE